MGRAFFSTSLGRRGVTIYTDPVEAVKDIPDGSKLVVGGKCLSFIAEISLRTIYRQCYV